MAISGKQIGEMTTDEIYQGLACLYLYKALERDKKVAAESIE